MRGPAAPGCAASNWHSSAPRPLRAAAIASCCATTTSRCGVRWRSSTRPSCCRPMATLCRGCRPPAAGCCWISSTGRCGPRSRSRAMASSPAPARRPSIWRDTSPASRWWSCRTMPTLKSPMRRRGRMAGAVAISAIRRMPSIWTRWWRPGWSPRRPRRSITETSGGRRCPASTSTMPCAAAACRMRASSPSPRACSPPASARSRWSARMTRKRCGCSARTIPSPCPRTSAPAGWSRRHAKGMLSA